MSGRRPESRIVADKSWDIDGIVAELADLRAIPQKRHYQGRPLPELPSRKVIVEVVDPQRQLVRAAVRGDGHLHRATYDPRRGWACSCPARSDQCCHLVALRRIIALDLGGNK